MKKAYPVIVIGGGHAGIEAACAAARLGVSTCIVTLKKQGIGQMSCNPAIGGLGKGHLVKEVDALGGLMARAIDQTGIQFRTLNSSKGPAVRASRAQADRDLYKNCIQKLVELQKDLDVIEAEVSEILTESSKVIGIKLRNGSIIKCECLVVTTGTFLRGLMHTGEVQEKGGRKGDCAAYSLSDSLKKLDFKLCRLKTGTPPRLSKKTLNLSILKEQPGETPPKQFSLMTEEITQPQIPCWITQTNQAVHDLIRSNKHRSPMFNGQINSGGPRYCPSIEDKVFRFADKASHNIFLEPEGYKSDLVYPNGISTSLPPDVQLEFVRQIKGLEQAEIVQYGYAVEYDAIDPRVLNPTLECKQYTGLFMAGQINGTSGYEEAAGQGLIAGANAAFKVLDKSEFILDRGQAYIGVMIDDLTTLGVDEPYRMFTSRAEYRLHLREDNAGKRLTPLAMQAGLISELQKQKFNRLNESYEKAKEWAEETKAKPSNEINSWLNLKGGSYLKETISISELIRRPELKLEDLFQYFDYNEPITPEIQTSLEIDLKFKGYLSRQDAEISKLRRAERERIPENFCYDEITSLRTEAKEKLKQSKPFSLGQAMRIPGITPATISLLAVHLKRFKEAKAGVASS